MEVWLVVAVLVGSAELSYGDLQKGAILDMSYALDETTLYWPAGSYSHFEMTVLTKGPWGEVAWIQSNRFCTLEHVGTHIDAPAHFLQGKWYVGDIPLNRLIAPAVRIDATKQTANNANYELTADDLQAWEKANGKIPDGSVLFFYTGWGARWPDRLAFFGSLRTDTHVDDLGRSTFHFPGIAPEAATWLVSNRNIYGFATEAPSVDCGQSAQMLSHKILLGADIWALENVANMDQLPTRGATVYTFPIRLSGGTGAPVRVVAVLDEVQTSDHRRKNLKTDRVEEL